MSADCRDADRVIAYVRGQLHGAPAEAFEDHVTRCSGCAALLSEEACIEVALHDLGEEVELELVREASRGSGLRAWWRARASWVPWRSWAPLAVATGLALVMCDHAAMRGLVDAASPAPGAAMARDRDAAPVDETRPGCEDVVLAHGTATEGPVCAEALALASFPPELDDPYADNDEGVCRPDDGGELVCTPDEPHAG